jgi:acetyl-CoA carboxylase biotin carboxylase subunit
MFQKILIANRGEIAVRIIRACKEMNIETVAVYSDVDKDSLHVQLADEAVCIGSRQSRDSYLHMENIVTAAIQKKAEAIHPGFGFLSENAKFAELCQSCNIAFIGPSGAVIEQMGNKANARALMIEAGVPVVPGSDAKVSSYEEAVKIAGQVGFPLLIKASAGGGGRGIKLAKNEDEFERAYNMARSEARVAFNDEAVYIERFLEHPKHIEFQILADKYGHVVHLGERDCSLQRRNQKVIEEAPSLLSDDLRQEMGECAVKAAKFVNYENAGTIEFLVEDGKFYFIEMNTRIQVEHPVTEMVTGIDLIQEQIRVAAGEELSFTQEDVVIDGHAIECRINAEDPKHGFSPSPTKVTGLHVPGGFNVRMDSFLYTGYQISPYYDSMIAKLIVKAKTREEAIKKMHSALSELIIQGVKTNQSFCEMILRHPMVQEYQFDTKFLEAKMNVLLEYDDE